jgi:putative transposase
MASLRFNGFWRNQLKRGGHNMARVTKKGFRIKQQKAFRELSEEDMQREARAAMIQELIPLGLAAVNEELQREFEGLVGRKHARGKPMGPWGSNPGSVYLGDQKVAIEVPRVRRRGTNTEVPLAIYESLQNSRVIDGLVLNRVINGISMKKYARAVTAIPETFGIKATSLSRRFKRASGKKLAQMNERDLSSYDIVAMFLDGKHFSTDHEIVVALGITLSGEKVILGMIETSTENYAICRDFLNGLLARGLDIKDPILCVIDGGKGIRKALDIVFRDRAVIGRCQWHKRENVLEYLTKGQRDEYRSRLQNAYDQKTEDGARKLLNAIKRDLALINQSAVNSLEEGFEETLILHKLGMFEKLGTSFKTTNCIENVNRQLGIYTDRVCYWKNSHQRQRWVATALWEIEPRLRKVRGYEHLAELRKVMQQYVVQKKKDLELTEAA